MEPQIRKPLPTAIKSQLPEWETPNPHTRNAEKPTLRQEWHDLKSSCSTTFNRLLPPHRRYLGLSRKVFCIGLLAISIALLALILGLSIGLSTSNRYSLYPSPLPISHLLNPLSIQCPAQIAPPRLPSIHRRSNLLRHGPRRMRDNQHRRR